MSSSPGFVGKLPSQGDFVSRRLTWEFLQGWDAWMQAGMASARQTLGTNWLDAYLVAPVWRFLLAPGLCGDAAWLGLWFPSIDRVGRHFPFTVAVTLPAELASPGLLVQQEKWFEQLEIRALAGLDQRIALEAIDQSLAECRLDPAALPSPLAGPPLASSCHAPAEFASLVGLNTCARAATSCWHTHGSDTVSPALCCFDGLPDAARFVAFLSASPDPVRG